MISASHFGLAKSPDDRRCPGVLHHAGPLLSVGEDHLGRPQLVHLRLGEGVLLLGGLQVGELQTLVVPGEEEAQLAGEQVVHFLDLQDLQQLDGRQNLGADDLAILCHLHGRKLLPEKLQLMICQEYLSRQRTYHGSTKDQGPRTKVKDLLPVCGREEDHGALFLVRTVVGAVDDLVTPGVKND